MDWVHILAMAVVILVTGLVINKSCILAGKSGGKRFLIQFLIYIGRSRDSQSLLAGVLAAINGYRHHHARHPG